MTAVHIGGIAAFFGQLGQETMMGREMADRIGGPRVTKEGECLAPASAEILPTQFAGSAGLRHPVAAAECLERG